MQNIPVITIDGPGGSGKGTICRLVAQQLGWHLLDSGAIYRVLALAAIHHDIAADDEEALRPPCFAIGTPAAAATISYSSPSFCLTLRTSS